MKIRIVIGISLSVYLLFIIPNICAIETHQIKQSQDLFAEKQSNQLKMRFEKYGFVNKMIVAKITFLILGFILIGISDFLSILGWMLLGAWDSSVGLGVVVIASSFISTLISLSFLFIGGISNPEFLWMIIPSLIALFPVYLPVLIWLLSPYIFPNQCDIINNIQFPS